MNKNKNVTNYKLIVRAGTYSTNMTLKNPLTNKY